MFSYIFRQKIILQSLPYLLIFVIVFPKLLGHGMFVDGVLYATVARNMSQGIGHFWQPHYTETMYTSFLEHPPLAIYLQSIIFDIFGDYRWIERVYTFIIGLSQLFLISLVWKNISQDKSLSWCAPFLFVITPVVFWVIANNELENTLVIFMLLSTLFIVYGCKTIKTWKAVFYGFIAALFIFLGFLSKGVFAFYPMFFPFFCYFFLKDSNKSKTIICQISIIFYLVFMMILLLLNADARRFFEVYFENQVFRSIAGKREIDNPHFQILWVLIEQIVLPMAICIILVLYNRNFKLLNFNKNTALFFLMALSASLPLVISSKNHGWYLMISMPFYAMTLASLFSNYLNKLQDWFLYKSYGFILLKIIFIFLIFLTIILSVRNFDKILKNAQYHTDFTAQGVMPITNMQINFCPWFRDNTESWMMIANFARDYKLSLSPGQNNRYRVYLLNQEKICPIPKACKRYFPYKPEKYALFDCKNDFNVNFHHNK
ncbi:ArnT family glycosyltransferase [Fluviispira multicolorata]|uniref:Glycosyltransferase RgtA/B/C/D-like domain-containing protein n=1 Tax=Fluviispira multicolorata TaxID=2654512 RepID=A0A833JH49_9BACT|nr:glycosyltransferase family 39 protein [Fluviispira multicolorata]KAB8033328.1 hypothetical protein GCL57_01115 [Fluviispira multicolorata]